MTRMIRKYHTTYWEYLKVSIEWPFYTKHQSKATSKEFLAKFSDAHIQFLLWKHEKEQDFVFIPKEEKRTRYEVFDYRIKYIAGKTIKPIKTYHINWYKG